MKRVLIVDDSPKWVEYHKEAISLQGNFETDTAYSAKSGLSKVEINIDNPYDIILTDMQMESDFLPLYAGEWFIEQIKTFKEYKNTKIIIISATSDIKRVAEKYLGKDKSAVSIVLPEASKEVKASSKTTVNNDYSKAVLKESDADTEKWELANGATLLYTPNPANEIVAIGIYAKGGNFVQNKFGVANMTASSILKGTKNYSAQELSELLEDNGIKVIPSARSDAFVISV